MAYKKQNFADGKILKAEHLNYIEEGIIANDTAIESVKDIFDITHGKINLLNPDEIIENSVIYNSSNSALIGSVVDNTSYCTTGYIPVKGGGTYGIYRYYNGKTTNPKVIHICFYSADRNYLANTIIAEQANNSQGTTVHIAPAGASYMRFSISMSMYSQIDILQVSEFTGNIPTALIAYDDENNAIQENVRLKNSDYISQDELKNTLSNYNLLMPIIDSVQYTTLNADKMPIIVEHKTIEGYPLRRDTISYNTDYTWSEEIRTLVTGQTIVITTDLNTGTTRYLNLVIDPDLPVNLIDNGTDYSRWNIFGGSSKSADGLRLVKETDNDRAVYYNIGGITKGNQYTFVYTIAEDINANDRLMIRQGFVVNERVILDKKPGKHKILIMAEGDANINNIALELTDNNDPGSYIYVSNIALYEGDQTNNDNI